MKITDLRIGNLVYDPSFKTVTKIGYLGFEGIVVLIKGCERVTRKVFLQDIDIEGIPLTREILSKINLGEEDITMDYSGNEIYIGVSGRGIGNEIIYVHQLQNLFYALSGEELEISL
jgi:hypothetical protein